MFERQQEQHTNQLYRLEEQGIHLQASKATAQVFGSMLNSSKPSQISPRKARMEEFDRVLDGDIETRDEIAEINEALGRPIGSAHETDDDDLLAELDEMDARDHDQQLLDVQPTRVAECGTPRSDSDTEKMAISA